MASIPVKETRKWPPIAPLVLVVDDQQQDRDYVRRVLVHSGFTPLEAATAGEAIALLDDDDRNHGMAAVIAERRSGGGGCADELLAWRDLHAPSLGLVCLTGCFDEPLDGVPTVFKPFAIRELIAAVRSVMPIADRDRDRSPREARR